MAREINLVPDIKGEMIKALKIRNYIFFISVLIAAASVGSVFIVGLIAGGQQLARDNKKETIEQLSAKLNSYSELSDVLTIKDQVNNLSAIGDNKKVLSRTFSAISALIPTGADTITISELNVNLDNEQPTFTFDAQANAGQDPFIDYEVLDSFKKSMEYMRYDYGNYVDKKGNNIPAYCMIEQGDDGATLRDENRGYYAYWTIEGEGCNPSEDLSASDYNIEDYNSQKVVRIWRTPQFSDWYAETEIENAPYMSSDGIIKNVEHFDSQCIKYTSAIDKDKVKPVWSEENNCHLTVGDSDNGSIVITDSSNGRDSSNELVLRFSATIYLTPEYYKFSNKHMIAIAPSGRRNVTDSYVQIQSVFGERARDCSEDDTACNAGNNEDKNKEDNKEEDKNNNTGGGSQNG